MTRVGIGHIADPDGDVAVVHDGIEEGLINHHWLRELEEHVVVADDIVDAMPSIAAVTLAGIGDAQPAGIAAEITRGPVAAVVAAEGTRVDRDPAGREVAQVAIGAVQRRVAIEIEADGIAAGGREVLGDGAGGVEPDFAR